jgi:hypothetical protein
MTENSLGLAAALGLIKDYDVLINGLWSLYAAVLAAVLTVLTTTKWRPRPGLLIGAFLVFAAGNAHGLSQAFATKKKLVAHAVSLVERGPPTLQDLVSDLSPSPVLGMLAFHALLDLVVCLVIFLIARQAAVAEVPSKNADPE